MSATTHLDSATQVGAIDVGYASLSAFAHAFHQLTGKTPARFRSRHAGG
ncbi:AraC family transcriptional regulator [Sphingomonas montanisoli]|uniref:Helix-turn-helix transcriptional regulator n=1 Tax=Sphingomonas montanisoli TaxID=2606412 RepID=A0A5D9CGB9_9SPHN|nr:AraC family transcriptional regulator [Sphingomonas montanisoli]TZG29105.1 helix-turn-helix transcriptional regulator [Sphingomonas montanisoli]